MSAGITMHLMEDDAEGAERELREASEEWVTEGFQLHHFLRLYMAGWIDLYAGHGRRSWDRLKQQWPALRRSMLLRVDDLRLRGLQIRAYSAVAAGSDPRLLRAAERDARSIARIKSSFGSEGIACIVYAAVALRRGRRDQARQRLERAAEVFDAAEMRLYAAAARRRLGELTGGDDGRELIEKSDALLANQKVRNPERMADVLAPGFRSTELTKA
jgi:hypothetical protein